jgi:hypothetical protein
METAANCIGWYRQVAFQILDIALVAVPIEYVVCVLRNANGINIVFFQYDSVPSKVNSGNGGSRHIDRIDRFAPIMRVHELNGRGHSTERGVRIVELRVHLDIRTFAR